MRVHVNPEVIFVARIDETAFGGEEFRGFVLAADQFVFDLLQVRPFLARLAVMPPNGQAHKGWHGAD